MGCLLFKEGVTLKPDPAGARLLGALDRVTRRQPFDVTVTCGSDGHPADDPHSHGRAFDVRTHGLTDEQKKQVLSDVLSDLRDDVHDYPFVMPIVGIWLAMATHRWFGQVEHHTEDGEHLHFQLRNGQTWPPAGTVTTWAA